LSRFDPSNQKTAKKPKLKPIEAVFAQLEKSHFAPEKYLFALAKCPIALKI